MKKFYTIRMDNEELRGKYYDINKVFAEIVEWQKYPSNKNKTFHIMELYRVVKGNCVYYGGM